MKCYVKSKSTFQTIAQRDADGFDLVLDSAQVEQSSVTILGEDSPSFLNGNWLIIDGELYRIDTVSPSKGKTAVKLAPVDTFFSRPLLYEEMNAATIGAFIAGIITAEWVQQSDTVYAAPYITVTSTDTTPFEQPETDDNGIYNLADYIRYVRAAHNIVMRWAYSGDTLFLYITKQAVSVNPLVLNDGHTQLVNSDFSSTALAKLTVFIATDTGQKDEDDNPIMDVTTAYYYLDTDGNVTDTEPVNRAAGEWGAITISGDDDPQEKAAEAFAGNEESRKIELYSDVQMMVGDRAKIRLNGEVIESTVMGIYRKSTEIRTRYKLGDLKTTLTEKIATMTGGTTTVVRSGGGSYVLTQQDKEDIADIVLAELPTWTGGSY